MIHPEPATLAGFGIRLEPLNLELYSILAAEWPDVRRHLELRLARHGPGA